MNFLMLIFVISMFGCSNKNNESIDSEEEEFLQVFSDDYELHKPLSKSEAVIIVFGGYAETISEIKEEFAILEEAKKNSVAVIYMNYKYSLWLGEDEKYQLAKKLQGILNEYELPLDNLYIGGFSSGGNVSFLISDYIVSMKQFYIDPKGIFIIDSPVDLAKLYENAVIQLKKDLLPEIAKREAAFLINMFEEKFGSPDLSINAYEKASVYTIQTSNIDNISKLKNTKIRLYTEPDTTWWKKERLADYKETNSYQLMKLSDELLAQGFRNIDYISTNNKGFRADGQRHPHSWSIVNVKELLEWMLEE